MHSVNPHHLIIHHSSLEFLIPNRSETRKKRATNQMSMPLKGTFMIGPPFRCLLPLSCLKMNPQFRTFNASCSLIGPNTNGEHIEIQWISHDKSAFLSYLSWVEIEYSSTQVDIHTIHYIYHISYIIYHISYKYYIFTIKKYKKIILFH
jgi:hypothetical protein